MPRQRMTRDTAENLFVFGKLRPHCPDCGDDELKDASPFAYLSNGRYIRFFKCECGCEFKAWVT